MIHQDNIFSKAINLILGIALFVLIVAGSTFYLQDSLLVYKQFDAHTHWAVILMGLPIVVGLLKRWLKINYPIITTLFGALISAYILHPYYSTRFWAEAPNMVDVAIYVLIITGISYIATQPIKNTFMMAFHLGRFSMPNLASTKNKNHNAKKSVRKPDMSKTQILTTTGRGSTLAMIELFVGVTSIGLSIFSIFFLGKS